MPKASADGPDTTAHATSRWGAAAGTKSHSGVVVSAIDGKPRCEWVSEDEPELLRYHDTVWGTPSHDPTVVFEALSLGVFEAGLGWLTVFHKRDAFQDAFYHFDPERVATMTSRDVTRLLMNEHIIRNRAKIEATVNNAVVATSGDRPLADVAWDFAASKVSHPKRWGDVRVDSPEAKALSAELKSEGYKFVGPTSVYAFMQSIGVVNDHIRGCFRAT
jgi:DNA-3-methyladenine glycosylase I